MKHRHRNRRGRESEELNITAFMNLMVVLVPFLLITAVFSRITVLELNLPVANDSPQEPKEQPLQLEVIVRAELLEVAYHGGAKSALVERGPTGFDLGRLSDLLQKVKAAFPDDENVTILLEPDVPYDTLVQVMDVARLYMVDSGGVMQPVELFPQIAIGDAPPPRGAG